MVIQGAGGVVTNWSGDNLTFDMDGTVIAAGDKTQLKPVLDLLNEFGDSVVLVGITLKIPRSHSKLSQTLFKMLGIFLVI